MRIILHRGRNGIALIIVMVTIFVLAALAGAFALAMKVETKLARNSTSELEMEWLGRSGVELARYVLALQLNIADEPYDALNQVWAGGPGGMSTSNSPLATISLKNHKLGNGTYSVTITDLERKLNINAAANSPEILQQAFILMGADVGDASQVIAAIQDWIDADDDPHIGGTESSYYQGLQPPYLAKNGPIDDISELLLIRGVTPEMYFGRTADTVPQGNPVGLPPPAPSVGLVNLFTPISTGKINVNTASAEVFQMIPGIDENMAAQMMQARLGPDGQTPVGGPGNSLAEFLTAGTGSQLAVGNLQKYFDTRSRTFEVDVEVSVGNYTRHYIAIVGRNSAQDIPVLTFRAK
jgi:general secretion pathway protein K